VRGLWQTSLPSRFLAEIPAEHVEFEDLATSSGFGDYGASGFAAFSSAAVSRYDTPGWRRAQRSFADQKSGLGYGGSTSERTLDLTSARRERPSSDLPFSPGARVFHHKFGSGSVAGVDGHKLTVDFDRAGRKLVMESFVRAER
jgi:DNA helicase II / ATP-dependent DNA helicase PcrA